MRGGRIRSIVLVASLLFATLTFTPDSVTAETRPPCGGNGEALVAGPDGNMWFLEGDGQIARMTTSGAIDEFPFDEARYSHSARAAAGSDGNVWVNTNEVEVFRVKPDGSRTSFPLPAPPVFSTSYVWGFTAGPDGALWALRSLQGAKELTRIATDGTVTQFPITVSGTARGLTVLDGSMWFLGGEGVANTTLYRAEIDGTIASIGTFSGYARSLVATGGSLWTMLEDYLRADAAFVKLTTSGASMTYTIPDTIDDYFINGTFVGGDGRAWIADDSSRLLWAADANGALTSYPYPTDAQITELGPGVDGNTWFVGNDVGSVDANGAVVLHELIPLAEGPPTLCSLSPDVGPTKGGTTITLTGRGFERAIAVRIGNKAVTSYTIDSDRQITAVTPSGSSEPPRYVTVSSAEGPSTANPEFRYAGPPNVDNACPMDGSIAGGYWTKVTGQDVDLATVVYFDGKPSLAVERIVSNYDYYYERHALRVKVPAHKGGVVRMQAKGPFGTGPLGGRFFYHQGDVHVDPCLSVNSVINEVEGIFPSA